MSFHLAEPHTCDTIDKAALRAWRRDGVLKVTGLVSREWVAYGRQRVREKLGAEPEEASAWANLKSGVLKPLGLDAQCVSIETESVRSAVDALIGEGWKRPKSGGSWFCNAPTQTHIEPGAALAVPIVFMRDFIVHSIPAIIGPGPRVCHVITASTDL